ncbi:MAG: cell wall-binding repeat-containing protein [Methanomicrobia archaeon]|nr:cell wall-binding repeat-containing protein [Methanomicrobia archaeon]
MKKLLLIFMILALSTVRADTYDAIVVRNSSDVIIDYIIAEAYSHKADIPVILTDPESLSVSARRALLGLRSQDAERVLIIGGSQAISTHVEDEIRNIGFDVDRKWGTDRNETAAIVAIDLWGECENVVLVNGNIPESFLVALRTSYLLKAPILLVDENKVPNPTLKAIETLNPENIYVIGPNIPDISGLKGEKKLVGTNIEVSDIEEKRKITFDYVSLLLGILVGGTSVFFVYRTYKRKISVEVPMFVLTEDERKIVDAVKSTGGEMKQEDLPEETGFSRPKVTKIIQDLENKKIISRLKYGKTYKVKIEKKFIKT